MKNRKMAEIILELMHGYLRQWGGFFFQREEIRYDHLYLLRAEGRNLRQQILHYFWELYFIVLLELW